MDKMMPIGRIHKRAGFVGGASVLPVENHRRRSKFCCYSSFNNYAILGLSPFASKDDVRSAYRRLALKYHPDVIRGNPAAAAGANHEFFREIKSAYESLMEKFEEEEAINTSSVVVDEWDDWDEWMGCEGASYPAL